jgi:hypothetical protein
VAVAVAVAAVAVTAAAVKAVALTAAAVVVAMAAVAALHWVGSRRAAGAASEWTGSGGMLHPHRPPWVSMMSRIDNAAADDKDDDTGEL